MLKRQSIYRLQFSLGLRVWQNAFMHVRQCIRVCPGWKKKGKILLLPNSLFPSYFLFRTLSDHGMNRITTYRSFSPSLWCEFKEMSRFTRAEMVEREKDFLKGQTSTSQGTREAQSFTKTTSLSSLITSLLRGGMGLFLVGIFFKFLFSASCSGKRFEPDCFYLSKAVAYEQTHTHTQTKVWMHVYAHKHRLTRSRLLMKRRIRRDKERRAASSCGLVCISLPRSTRLHEGPTVTTYMPD